MRYLQENGKKQRPLRNQQRMPSIHLSSEPWFYERIMACKCPTNKLIAPKHAQQQTKHRIVQTNAQNSRTLETVKIAQLNGQISRSVIDEIRVYMAKMSINAIALQEPCNSNGVIRRVGVTTKVILGIKAFTGSVKYRSQKLAIAVRNPEIKCLKLDHLCFTHFTCVEIVLLSTRFYLDSAYMQYSDSICYYLQTL